jgi:hypothetical protein
MEKSELDKIIKDGITEEWIEKHKDFLCLYKTLMENKTCPMCKFKHKGWNDLSTHMKTTHGIPSLYDLLVIYLDSK